MTIKSIEPQAQVGLVTAVLIFDPPCSWSLPDTIVARLLNKNLNESHFTFLTNGRFHFSIPGMVNESYTASIKDAFDFIGLNYYTRQLRRISLFGSDKFIEIMRSRPDQLTDMGWEIYPEGLYRALELINQYTNKPVYITENGIADDNDTRRAKFIEHHLLVLNRAISEGMNIKGYFYWSLIDNFEWAYGFEKRFGLYHVDYKTQERTLREGSRKYIEIINKSRE
jgi:beta-glucosidase